MQFFSGLMTTCITAVIASLSLALIYHFQGEIAPYLDTIRLFSLLLLAGCAVFAAQFNHSRISLVCVWMLFISLGDGFIKAIEWPIYWHLLATSLVLISLSLMKDRGLVSVHGVFRVIVIVTVCLASWFWLTKQTLILGYVSWSFLQTIKPYLIVEIPLGLMALVLVWQSLRLRCLTRSALLFMAVLWFVLQRYQFIDQRLVLAFIAMHCLLVVVINSYLLAYRDDLTGLPSRRALNQLALSLGSKYTVAMMDIDHFKKFNDTYGHDIGDQVLKLVASKLAKVQGGGKVFRYGGEEFTVVYPRKSTEQTLAFLDALRQSIADYGMIVRQPERKTKNKNARGSTKGSNEKTVSVTISIGVAQRQSKQTFEQTLKEADLALYRAKKKGRNNVSQ